jgi:opacity protein-like surface antigen
VAAFSIPFGVNAQSLTGPYISGQVGAGVLSSPLASDHGFTKIGADAGPEGAAALGWRFSNNFRAEVQGSFQSNGVNGVLTQRGNGTLQPLTNAGGNISAYSIATNILYDFHWIKPVQPYVGFGAGYGWLNASGVGGAGSGTLYAPGNNTFTGPDSVHFGTAGAFAYQAFAGVALPIQQVRGLALTAEYRFFGTGRAAVPVSRVSTAGVLINGVVPKAEAHDGFVAADNILSVGFRYNFGLR